MVLDNGVSDVVLSGSAIAIFSDVHFGNVKSKHKQLLTYLQLNRHRISTIVAAGDLIDTWVCPLEESLEEAKPLFEFLAKYYYGQFIYLLGNHDEDIHPICSILPFIMSSLNIIVNNKRIIVLHGHILDPNPYIQTKLSRWMAWFINKFDGWANVDTRKSLVSLSERIKNDPYDQLLEQFETNLFSTFSGKYDIVVTGHTHRPEFRRLHDLLFVNAGDSTEHSTLVLLDERELSLVDYQTGRVLDVESL